MCIRIPEFYDDVEKDEAIVRNILRDIKEGNRDWYLSKDLDPDKMLETMINEMPPYNERGTQIVNYKRGPFHEFYDIKRDQAVIEVQQYSSQKRAAYLYKIRRNGSVKYLDFLYSSFSS